MTAAEKKRLDDLEARVAHLEARLATIGAPTPTFVTPAPFVFNSNRCGLCGAALIDGVTHSCLPRVTC